MPSLPDHLTSRTMTDSLAVTDPPESGSPPPVPLHLVSAAEMENLEARFDAATAAWAGANGFKGKEGDICPCPAADGGGLAGVLVGHAPSSPALWSLAGLPRRLPEGKYALASDSAGEPAETEARVLGWMLGAYAYDLYKDAPRGAATLVWPDGVDQERVTATARAVCLTRDLINTPAQDLLPSALAAAAEDIAKAHGATFTAIVGDDLLSQNYPAIHAVGRASADAPRLIDLRWGDKKAPKVTLVGKGVCFDSGGLDIKSAAGMKFMKKDMGGGATVLGLASLIMATKLPVCLRVLIPAVENAIAGNSLHPLDVIRARNGKTIEIGHTDAEGRVILSDALADASEEEPALLLDFATLTGAARVALGPELPALFANDDELAADLLAAGEAAADPLWRLPLWDGYRKMIDGDTADITNSADGPFGGAITAALFLREFVGKDIPWAHVDTYGWNAETKPGRPKGGEALGLRAAYDVIRKRFAG